MLFLLTDGSLTFLMIIVIFFFKIVTVSVKINKVIILKQCCEQIDLRKERCLASSKNITVNN